MTAVSDDLNFTVSHTQGPLTVVTVAGEADLYTAPGLRTAALELIEQGRHHLIMDLSQVTFCDSAGLSALIGLWHAAQDVGGSFVLAAVPDRLQRMLKLTGLDAILATHPTTGEALAAHPG
ncbi:STAS domain-containing protein [Streptomyces leeuwenhoekii]|uniref:Anti-sigma factor antagonist n=1 Tax=Streptomyces leeuwenhoekii TaxID=1437453 RepID=A0A0F7VKQ5_STRLW|nr:STAS domain-containing protein [Streptomyces leeuwenhoekii]CQR59514.1 Anti-sigma-B factor antagonist [Streptomyces leeuwenhoekii]